MDMPAVKYIPRSSGTLAERRRVNAAFVALLQAAVCAMLKEL